MEARLGLRSMVSDQHVARVEGVGTTHIEGRARVVKIGLTSEHEYDKLICRF